MNFNYSYKAFLIATLLVGNLILLMYSVKLSKTEEIQVEEYDIEYALEDLFPEEELAALSTEHVKIETHKAFNEAEKFISELESERNETSENTQDKLSEMDQAIDDVNANRKAITPPKKDNPKKKKKENSEEEGNNKNSTNSYRLLNRKALHFPNPVYVCEGYGKVVLHIEVDNFGKVIQATLNKNSSTTSNVCLIESAITYAKKARFSKDANKLLQMGSISYIFPGQQ